MLFLKRKTEFSVKVAEKIRKIEMELLEENFPYSFFWLLEDILEKKDIFLSFFSLSNSLLLSQNQKNLIDINKILKEIRFQEYRKKVLSAFIENVCQICTDYEKIQNEFENHINIIE